MIETILEDCLKEIRAGRMTVADCLAKYPAVAAELAPLLQMATALDELPDIQPAPEFERATRARLLQLPPPARVARARATRALPALRFAFAALLLVAVALLTSTGVANAAEASLPGEPLYAVKRANENVALFFAGDAARQAQLRLAYADKRLDEVEKLRAAGQSDLAAQTLDAYAVELRAARAGVEKLDAAAQKEFFAQVTRQHARLRVLAAPPELLEEIERVANPAPTPQLPIVLPTPIITVPTNTITAPAPTTITPRATVPVATVPTIPPVLPTALPIVPTSAPGATNPVPPIVATNPPLPPAQTALPVILTPPLVLPTPRVP